MNAKYSVQSSSTGVQAVSALVDSVDHHLALTAASAAPFVSVQLNHSAPPSRVAFALLTGNCP